MSKNENNSHAFIRKMVENIKQTKDGQCPDDPKINEVSALTAPVVTSPAVLTDLIKLMINMFMSQCFSS